MILTLLGCGAAAPHSQETLQSSGFEEILDRWHAEGSFDGVAGIGTADNDETTRIGCRGLASREWSLPNTPTTRFRIASITKQFTAVLVMRLAQDRLVSLDDPIGAHLADLPTTWANRVRVRDLLSHLSGLPQIPEEYYTRAPIDLDAGPRSLGRWLEGPLQSEPGSRFCYNNADAIVLGMLVASKRGMPLAEVLRTTVLEPLGMRDTGLLTARGVTDSLATGYQRVGAGWQREEPFFIENFGAAGAMYSTVNDLLRWDRALVQGTLLDANAAESMWESTAENGHAAFFQWTYPLEVVEGRASRVIERNGEIAAFRAVNLIDLTSRTYAVVLSNHDSLSQSQAWTKQGMGFELLREASTSPRP